MLSVDKGQFEAFWGYVYDDVVEGTVGYSYSEWFSALERAVDRLKLESNEKDTTKVLAYMACITAVQDASGRDVSEKTFPNFNMAILELQKNFLPFSWMMQALHTRHFRKAMAQGLSNVEAVKAQKSAFEAALKASFVPGSAKRAHIDIEWS